MWLGNETFLLLFSYYTLAKWGIEKVKSLLNHLEHLARSKSVTCQNWSFKREILGHAAQTASLFTLAVVTQLCCAVRWIMLHPGLFWQLFSLALGHLDQAAGPASQPTCLGSRGLGFVHICDFQLFLSWASLLTAAPWAECLHHRNRWQLAIQNFHFLLHCSGIWPLQLDVLRHGLL